MSKFQMGEIAAYVGLIKHPQDNGKFVKILSLPQPRDYISEYDSWNGNYLTPAGDYLVLELDNNLSASVAEANLRKLPPDSDSKTLPDWVTKLFDGRKVSNPDRKPVAV